MVPDVAALSQDSKFWTGACDWLTLGHMADLVARELRDGCPDARLPETANVPPTPVDEYLSYVVLLLAFLCICIRSKISGLTSIYICILMVLPNCLSLRI